MRNESKARPPSNILEAQFRRKRRRNSSTEKTRSSLYLTLESNKRIQPLLEERDDKDVKFYDQILFLDPTFKLQPYELLITATHLYLFKQQSGKLKIECEFRNIIGTFLSHQSDNFLLIRLQSIGDIVLVSKRKVQIVDILASLWQRNSNFPIQIADRFKYTVKNKGKFAIVFSREPCGVRTSIYKEKEVQSPDNR